VLDGRNNETVVTDDGGQAGIDHHVEVGADPGRVRQVGAKKLDAVVDRGRKNGHIHRLARMKADPGNLN
jgi:hypothetical protein